MESGTTRSCPGIQKFDRLFLRSSLVSARVIWRSLIVRLTPNGLVDILNN